jgi:general secretion pathway protein C
MTKIFYPIFNILILSAIIYLGVDIFYRFIEGQISQMNTHKVEVQLTPAAGAKKRTSLSDFDAITDRNIFGSAEKVSEEIKKSEIEALEPTTLKVALLGTITDSHRNSVAIIEDKTNRKQDLYRVGDSVQDAVIKMIVRSKVVLRVGDKDEVLTMVESSSSSEPERPGRIPTRERSIARTITLRQEDIEKSFENINDLLSQARIQPNLKDGVADGFRITGIKSGSIFRRMGLRNGDIIRTVNGSTVSSMDEAMAIYNDLKSGGSSVSLEIERSGQPRTLNYKVR